MNLYTVLGVNSGCLSKDIDEAYKKLVRLHHPDKGGDLDYFRSVRHAYDVLSDPQSRKAYDLRGEGASPEVTRSAADDFRRKYRSQNRKEDDIWDLDGEYSSKASTMQEKEDGYLSHSLIRKPDDDLETDSGFSAWLRNKKKSDFEVVTPEILLNRYNVQAVNYDPVPLPALNVFMVKCTGFSSPCDKNVSIVSERLPSTLEWGEVLVKMLATPISRGDILTLEGLVDSETFSFPFIGGTEGVGEILKVGPGCQLLNVGNWVIPKEKNMGTWSTMRVWKEAHLIRIPKEVGCEQASLVKHLCLAYRLLEDFVVLESGDTLILNGGTGVVSSVIIQLCRILHVRPIVVIRDRPDYPVVCEYLKELGASLVVRDTDPIRIQIEKARLPFPRLALDCIGGHLGVTLAQVLSHAGTLVVYGGLSKRSLIFSARAFLYGNITVKGFRLAQWIEDNGYEKFSALIEKVLALLKEDKIRIQFKTFELGTHFQEALKFSLKEKTTKKTILKIESMIGEEI